MKCIVKKHFKAVLNLYIINVLQCMWKWLLKTMDVLQYCITHKNYLIALLSYF